MTLCACGCGKEIIIKPHHKYDEIPKYIKGHYSKTEEFKNKISVLSSERFKGKPKSEEHKKKLSQTRIKMGLAKGKNNPMYGIKRCGSDNPFYGKHHTEDSIKKIKEGLVERYYGKNSEEYRNKLSEAHKGLMCGEKNPFYGMKHTNESKEKMSSAHRGVKPSQETIQKLKEAFRGENHPNWKGGITTLNKQIRHCDKYIEWSVRIFKRDNYTCQECYKRGGNMNAHHIKSFSNIVKENNITTLESSLVCDELWNLNNGITLCEKCHRKTFGKKGKKS